MASAMKFHGRPFRRRAWGPLHLVGQQWGAEVTVPDGPTVTIDFRKVRKPTTAEEEERPAVLRPRGSDSGRRCAPGHRDVHGA